MALQFTNELQQYLGLGLTTFSVWIYNYKQLLFCGYLKQIANNNNNIYIPIELVNLRIKERIQFDHATSELIFTAYNSINKANDFRRERQWWWFDHFHN